MLLSRWRRIVTGIAAGIIVLCSAMVGASFRDDNTAVSVASEIRGATPIPIEVEPESPSADGGADDDSVTVIEPEDLPDDTATDDAPADDVESSTVDSEDAVAPTDDAPAEDSTADTATDDAPADDSVTVIEADDLPDGDATEATGDDSAADDDATGDPDNSASEEDAPAPAPTAAPTAPLASGDSALGTGGGVDDAECGLDRLVIYAGARVGGVAGQIRAALAQAGFAAGCPAPVTVLASNCPLQFAGVLGAGSGYDPSRPYVASSASVDRDTMTAIMGTVGYTGNSIDILDFSFVNPDKPGEQWVAIFIPPNFSGWENLASRAGLAPSTQSLCAPSGELAG